MISGGKITVIDSNRVVQKICALSNCVHSAQPHLLLKEVFLNVNEYGNGWIGIELRGQSTSLYVGPMAQKDAKNGEIGKVITRSVGRELEWLQGQCV